MGDEAEVHLLKSVGPGSRLEAKNSEIKLVLENSPCLSVV